MGVCEVGGFVWGFLRMRGVCVGVCEFGGFVCV